MIIQCIHTNFWNIFYCSDVLLQSFVSCQRELPLGNAKKNRWSRVCCVWSSWRDLLKIVHTLNVSCLVIWCVHLSKKNSSNTTKYHHNHWIMNSWCHLQNSFSPRMQQAIIFNKIKIMHRMMHWLGKYVNINFKFHVSRTWTSEKFVTCRQRPYWIYMSMIW